MADGTEVKFSRRVHAVYFPGVDAGAKLDRMNGFPSSAGRRFGSVALRYRQPINTTHTPQAGSGATRRFLLHNQPADQFFVGTGPDVRATETARLEAVLLIAREPQGSRKLAQLAGLSDGTKARTLVRALNRMYDSQGSAFRIEEVAGGFQLLSRVKFAPWLRRLHAAPVEVRLSTPAMETLAVVAYRQPILRADIEAVRGVQCGEMLRQLIERDLVRIAGRSEELGRPFLYATSKRFLQIFGLRHLDELPRAELLRIVTLNSDSQGADNVEKKVTDQINRSYPVSEETQMKTLTMTDATPEELAEFNEIAGIDRVHAECNVNNDEDDCDVDEDDMDYGEDYDEDYDDDDDDDDDDGELEDEPWEEVEEDEEELDEDEDDEWEDEDWEDEEK